MVRQANRPAEEEPRRADFEGADRPLVPQQDQSHSIAGEGRALVIGCGALARELVAVTGGLPGVDVACLSPDLHNRPERIPGQVRDRIRDARADGYERIFVAYADCGTGGLIDPVLAEEGVERLAGAHCYEFFAGHASFTQMAGDEPATFWLTDFLARNFERLVIQGLGIDRHPELEPMYFANYRRLVYLSQTHDPELLDRGLRGRRAAPRGRVIRAAPNGSRRRRAPGGRRRGCLMATLTVIWWRDIPAQVIARDGRRSSKAVLHPRFQVAIDKAASRAGKRAYNDYIEEWRKIARACGDDLESEVTAETEKLETTYDKHRLAALIQSGGIEGGPALAPAHDETPKRATDAPADTAEETETPA
jgi:uncharacterized protein DUF1638/cvfA/B/C family virulence factor